MKNQYLLLVLVLAAALVLPGCASRSSNCASPEVFCVGLVTEVGRLDDHAYNQAAWDGVKQAKSAKTADWIASIESVDARDYGENIAVFADAGYDVIVTVGSEMGDATRSAAGKYPGTYFIGVDQSEPTDQAPAPNLAGVVFPADQIGFLAGAAAALVSQTGKVAAVCVSQEWLPVQLYARGFQAGAEYIDVQVDASVVFHDEVGLEKTFIDPEWGAATANALVDQGVDVIFGVGGTTGSEALVTASKRGAYGIGVDIDEYFTLPVAAPRLLTSVIKNITPATADLIGRAKDAQADLALFPAGNYPGEVGLASFHDLEATVPAALKVRLAELNQALVSGQVRTGISESNP